MTVPKEQWMNLVSIYLVKWRWQKSQCMNDKESAQRLYVFVAWYSKLATQVCIEVRFTLTCIAVTLVDQLNVVGVHVNTSRPVDVLPRDAEMLAAWIAVAQIPIERLGSRTRINRTVGAGFARIALVGWIAPVSLVDNPNLENATAAVECHVSTVASVLSVRFKKEALRVKFQSVAAGQAKMSQYCKLYSVDWCLNSSLLNWTHPNSGTELYIKTQTLHETRSNVIK